MSFLNTIVCGNRADDLLNRGFLRTDVFTAIVKERGIETPDTARKTWRKLGGLYKLLDDESPVQFTLDYERGEYLLIARSLGSVAGWCASPANTSRVPDSIIPTERHLAVCEGVVGFVEGIGIDT